MFVIKRKHVLIFFVISFLISLTSCQFKDPSKTHGINALKNKEKILIINKSNKNDVIKLIGRPHSVSVISNDIWIYVERKETKSSVVKLGKKTLVVNNVLILEINNKGLLEKKQFLNMNDMNKIKFAENTTEVSYNKNSFVYDFLSSMRRKINDPLGKNKKK